MSAPNSFARAVNVPAAPTESRIWRVDGASGALAPAWVNADARAAPAQQLAYVPASGAFALVGDLAAFQAAYGSAYPAVSRAPTFVPLAGG